MAGPRCRVHDQCFVHEPKQARHISATVLWRLVQMVQEQSQRLHCYTHFPLHTQPLPQTASAATPHPGSGPACGVPPTAPRMLQRQPIAPPAVTPWATGAEQPRPLPTPGYVRVDCAPAQRRALQCAGACGHGTALCALMRRPLAERCGLEQADHYCLWLWLWCGARGRGSSRDGGDDVFLGSACFPLAASVADGAGQAAF